MPKNEFRVTPPIFNADIPVVLVIYIFLSGKRVDSSCNNLLLPVPAWPIKRTFLPSSRYVLFSFVVH